MPLSIIEAWFPACCYACVMLLLLSLRFPVLAMMLSCLGGVSGFGCLVLVNLPTIKHYAIHVFQWRYFLTFYNLYVQVFIRQKNMAQRKKTSVVSAVRSIVKGPLTQAEISRITDGIKALMPFLPAHRQNMLMLPPARPGRVSVSCPGSCK